MILNAIRYSHLIAHIDRENRPFQSRDAKSRTTNCRGFSGEGDHIHRPIINQTTPKLSQAAKGPHRTSTAASTTPRGPSPLLACGVFRPLADVSHLDQSTLIARSTDVTRLHNSTGTEETLMKIIALILMTLSFPTFALAQASDGNCRCKEHCRRGSNLYASLKGGTAKCLTRCERDYSGCKAGEARSGRRPIDVK